MFPLSARGILVHLIFWVLAAAGWYLGRLTGRRLGFFVAIWLVGVVGLPFLPMGALWLTAFVALVDIVLVLIVFKGDIKIY